MVIFDNFNQHLGWTITFFVTSMEINSKQQLANPSDLTSTNHYQIDCNKIKL